MRNSSSLKSGFSPAQWLSTRSKVMDRPGLPVDVAVGAGARRPLVEALEALLVPLRLADDPQIAGARRGIRHDRHGALHAEDDLVVVDGLHLLGRAPEAGQGRGRILTQHERVGMHDVLGGELAVAVVELHPLAQVEGPLFQVGAGLPLLRQAGGVLARLGVDVEQRLQERVELEMVGAGDGPEAVALGEAGGGKNEALDLGFAGRRR